MSVEETMLTTVIPFLVALVTSIITALVSLQLQKDRLRAELKLEFAAESAIRDLLSEEKWKLRSFDAIKKRLKGFDDDELRKLLIRSGAICFERRDDGKEMWGLRVRNRGRLEQESKDD